VQLQGELLQSGSMAVPGSASLPAPPSRLCREERHHQRRKGRRRPAASERLQRCSGICSKAQPAAHSTGRAPTCSKTEPPSCGRGPVHNYQAAASDQEATPARAQDQAHRSNQPGVCTEADCWDLGLALQVGACTAPLRELVSELHACMHAFSALTTQQQQHNGSVRRACCRAAVQGSKRNKRRRDQ
jgi:hypothetical protein